MSGIAFAGNIIVDHLKFVKTWPVQGALSKVDRQSFVLGGLVNNCAIDLAKLDPSVPIQIIGRVGDDAKGDLILDTYAGYPSVDTGNVKRVGETAFTDVLTTPDGSRTFFTFMGCNADLVPDDFDFDRIDADILHVGYILLLDGMDAPDPEYGTALCRVLARARERGIATSVDVVSEDSYRYSEIVPHALKYADYCIMNEVEAGRTTGIEMREGSGKIIEGNIEKGVRALAAMGVHRWTVVHMPELSAAYDAQAGQYHVAPSKRVPDGYIKSTVGAGDAFAVGVLYGAYNGWDIEKTIDAASAIAAYSLAGAAASDAIRPFDEIMAEVGSWQ
ncbi:MAG: carbohydrate kinase family protein [Clostridiales Family XIII bacterium]|jgi:sugar/nucleoside kinase (ribokinase family)|nr:carbohydrate kinase family protein [Clostridiales Family XIII bacterium]